MNPAFFVAIALKCANPDVLVQADADLPFSAQEGYHAQVAGKGHPVARIAEDGIHGSPLPGGETLRFGRVPDPANPQRKAFALQVAPEDPKTSGSKRAEITFPHNIEHDRVYWAAVSVYVYDWGDIAPRGDNALFGMQLHSGDNKRRLSPVFGIYTAGPRHFRIEARASPSPDPRPGDFPTFRYAEHRLPFGRWLDFVFKLRLSTQGKGYLHGWMDGRRIVEHEGSLGFRTPGFNDYFKFGYYNWSAGFSSPRKVLVRSPTVVLDPTGDKYRPDDVRALLNQDCGQVAKR
jgi:hypothetical protein